MTFQLKFTKEAQKELQDIKKFTIENWGLVQARKYLKTFNQAFQMIKNNPKIGRLDLCNWPGIYRFPIQSHMVYYQLEGPCIYVMAILHQSMLPENHL
ncbi:type II toxin-antitoxin system RelE/ParE family toxin [Marinicella rhabdoformis]|uniref:type II toxin-antitoxin system RelE/ParE family toxin n=1 Tax=Marinicella rhabdoformis TaxID=2580566 RepID=UPI0012AECAEC